jgi:glycosyltransferase involved in cell wall biosynthesis
MLVSVALPIYNGLPYLQEAISTILMQDIELELIVSDDMSRDGSKEFVQGLTDPRVRLIAHDVNAGIFGNLNTCIAAAKGKFIQIFSQDDLMKPNYLVSQVQMLQKYPDAGFVYGTPDWVDENGSFISSNSADKTPEVIDRNLYLWIASHYMALPASISSVMIPRRTLELVGLFNTEYRIAADIEFYNRVSERFCIIRNLAVLHSIRSHKGMTSALPTAGPLYLRDELAFENWYQDRWNVQDYRRILRFRAASRGRYHLSWIMRNMRRGRIAEAASDLWRLATLFPLHWIIWWRVWNILRPNWRPRPTVSPPPL